VPCDQPQPGPFLNKREEPGNEVGIYLEEQYFDIISLNETMLDSSISDHEIKINGYDIVRKDRNRHGGEVAIYLRNSLNYTVRDDRSRR
jgi:hypothetical protein